MNNPNFSTSTRGIALLFGVAIAFLLPPQPGRSEPLPDPPLVGAAPDPCIWIIDVKQKAPRQGPPSDPQKAEAYKRLMDIYPRMLRVIVEKSGKDRHEETIWENGKKDTLWLYKGMVILQPKDWPADKTTAFAADLPMSPIKGGAGPDFPELAWVQPEFFVGTVMYEGKSTYCFQSKTGKLLTGGDPLQPGPNTGLRAWIDVRTRLPIAVEDSSMVKKYTYQPSGDILKPAGIFLAAYEKATRKAK